MHVKTKAIVLNSLKYGESQIIVDLLTESVGRVSFMQRIPRSSRSGISKQLFVDYFHYCFRHLMNRVNSLSSYHTQDTSIFYNTPISFGASTIYDNHHNS